MLRVALYSGWRYMMKSRYINGGGILTVPVYSGRRYIDSGCVLRVAVY
jgi:hypothetical protein